MDILKSLKNNYLKKCVLSASLSRQLKNRDLDIFLLLIHNTAFNHSTLNIADFLVVSFYSL